MLELTMLGVQTGMEKVYLELLQGYSPIPVVMATIIADKPTYAITNGEIIVLNRHMLKQVLDEDLWIIAHELSHALYGLDDGTEEHENKIMEILKEWENGNHVLKRSY